MKVTPSHDRDDYEIGLRHELDLLKVMDDKGVMNEEAGKYAGLIALSAERIVADLKRLGFLDKIEDYDHAVGHCYRCKTVIEPTPLSSGLFCKAACRKSRGGGTEKDE